LPPVEQNLTFEMEDKSYCRCTKYFPNNAENYCPVTVVNIQAHPHLNPKYFTYPMNQFLVSLALCAAALFAPQAYANQALANAKNCMSCHAVDKKLVGPAFKDVAAKYAADKNATSKLVAKVMQGGAGVWGTMPMPANPQVTEVEAKQLVAWVLLQKEGR
jgi:cytochrome c